jgi:hypothetical protein
LAPIMWIQVEQLVARRPLLVLTCTLALVAGVSLSACAIDDRQPEVVAPKTGAPQSGSNQPSRGARDAGDSCGGSTCVAIGSELPIETTPASTPGAGGSAMAQTRTPQQGGAAGGAAGTIAEPASGPRARPPRCVAPNGVSGAPRNIPDAVTLLNALPKPTTLDCFLESLDRPIDVFATSSTSSLQPALEADSPRMFIVRGALQMSIVPAGSASARLLLGFRTTVSRSIKAEILFPLQTALSMSSLFDGVLPGSPSNCGQCHADEIQITRPDFPGPVFESDVIDALPRFDVTVDTLRAASETCDAQAQPERCAMLSALFDYGDVLQH